MSRERLAAGAVHYAADCRRRMSHGPRVVVTATARSGVPSHGATPRGRQLSARIISFFEEGVGRWSLVVSKKEPEPLAA